MTFPTDVGAVDLMIGFPFLDAVAGIRVACDRRYYPCTKQPR